MINKKNEMCTKKGAALNSDEQLCGLTTFLSDNKKHYGIYQAPCQNHCTELKQKLIAQQNEKAVGLRLKQIYLKSAKDHNVQNNEVSWHENFLSVRT